MSLAVMPQEIKSIIVSFLDHNALCYVQALSHEWHVIGSRDQLWQDLFKDKFPNNLSPIVGQAQKKFKEKTLAIPIKDESHLEKTITKFFCTLKWDKKRELVCFFPNEPSYSLKLAQSFGPQRGTKAGFEEAPADETEYYQFMGAISPDYPAHRNHDTQKYITGLPYSFSRTCSSTFHSREGWPRVIHFSERFVEAHIEGVDVGFSNTLGYYSSLNDWKSPFELFCISDTSLNKFFWVGLIPLHEEFKFVSIDSQGVVNWEKRPDNRIVRPHGRFDPHGHTALRESLRESPIEFS